MSCTSKYLLTFLAFIFYSSNMSAQMPAKQQNYARFTKEIWGGLTIHTFGLGLNLNYAKFKTYKKKVLYTLDIVGMQHEKEYKIFGSIDENAKRYVYGKLNSFYVIRPGIGKRKMFFEKLRDNGMQIAVNWSFGPSIGITKPVYLEVLKIDQFGQVIGNSVEKYDPESHNLYNIYGRGPWSRGLAEAKFHPGGFAKIGLEFEYSNERDLIRAIEVGSVIDVYPKRIPIMTNVDNPFIFPTIYLNFIFGAKFY